MADYRCQAKDECAALSSEGAAQTAEPILCPACVTQIQQRLDQLAIYRGALESFKAKSLVPQGGGAKVSGGSTEGSTPINLHILDLIKEVEDALSWVRGDSVATLATRPDEEYTIWRHDRWVKFPLDGIRVALNVSRAWRKAEDALGFTRTWERRFGKCPKCLLPTLGNFSGENFIQCSNCGGVMSREEYARITIIRANK